MKSLAGHVVKYGKHRERRSFAQISEVLELPNLIEIQTDSYQWFLDEGLSKKCLKIFCQLKTLMAIFHWNL